MSRKRHSDEDVLKLLREVLNAEWFTTTKQAQIVINQWLRQYSIGLGARI